MPQVVKPEVGDLCSGVVYDAAGNVTNDGLGNTYTYDAENRLTSMSGNNSASYVYDAFGHRVRATISSVPYDFLYSGGRAVDEYTSSGWVWGDAGAAQLAVYANSTTYFSHNDWLGSLRAWSNVSGSSVETCTTMPFGDAQTCTGTAPNSWSYTGLPFDSESGMSHALFRQLSTTQGRWTTSDPAGLGAVDPTNPQTWNRYAYVANNPLSFTDPSGLLLKGPVSTCVPGDTVVCGGGGIDGSGGGAAGAGGGDGGIADPGGGVGGFCDASGDCTSGIGGVGGVLPPITLDGSSLFQQQPFGPQIGGIIQFGAAAINSDYQNYLYNVAAALDPINYLGLIIPDPQYLAFLKVSAPTLSPTTPVYQPGGPAQKPPNPCNFFPTKSCFPPSPPNPLSLQFLTMGSTATQFWDLVP